MMSVNKVVGTEKMDCEPLLVSPMNENDPPAPAPAKSLSVVPAKLSTFV